MVLSLSPTAVNSVALLLSALSTCSGLVVGTMPRVAQLRGGMAAMADIGDTGVSFDKVAREWRCKYSPGESGGPGDSASLKACNDLLMEYLPKLKALPGAEITRQVCGGCLDFKVSITQPLEEHGAFMADLSLEDEFMGKLKGIEGTSLHETQEITFVSM